MTGQRQRSFLLVSTQERRELFLPVLANYQARFATSVAEAVRACVSDPPMAALLDLASTLHAGVAETAPLYDLGIDLPILRCTGATSEALVAMCQAPFKRLPLPQALMEIASGDSSWRNPANPRRYVRVRRNLRAVFRARGAETWTRANAQSISISGMFLLTLDPPTAGTEVEVQLLDASAEPLVIRADVVWVHRWEEGTHLPGCGLNFNTESVPPELGALLAEWFFQKR